MPQAPIRSVRNPVPRSPISYLTTLPIFPAPTPSFPRRRESRPFAPALQHIPQTPGSGPSLPPVRPEPVLSPSKGEIEGCEGPRRTSRPQPCRGEKSFALARRHPRSAFSRSPTNRPPPLTLAPCAPPCPILILSVGSGSPLPAPSARPEVHGSEWLQMAQQKRVPASPRSGKPSSPYLPPPPPFVPSFRYSTLRAAIPSKPGPA